METHSELAGSANPSDESNIPNADTSNPSNENHMPSADGVPSIVVHTDESSAQRARNSHNSLLQMRSETANRPTPTRPVPITRIPGPPRPSVDPGPVTSIPRAEGHGYQHTPTFLTPYGGGYVRPVRPSGRVRSSRPTPMPPTPLSARSPVREPPAENSAPTNNSSGSAQEGRLFNSFSEDENANDDDFRSQSDFEQSEAQHPGPMLSAGPAQNDVYTKIANAVILRRYMGHDEVAESLKDYLLNGMRTSHAQMFLDIAEEQLSAETTPVTNLWRRTESLMLIGRAVERIGESAAEEEEREDLVRLFGEVLEADLEDARGVGS